MTIRAVTIFICAALLPLALPFAPGADSVAAANQARPRRPTITEPGAAGQVVHPGDVHMATGPYFDREGHAHYCTTWVIIIAASGKRVWEDICDRTNKVHVHLGDGRFVGPYAGRTQLSYGREYKLRVRFRQATSAVNRWSLWSGRRFNTSAQPPPGTATAWTAQPGFEVEVVAGGLQLPVNIAFVPTAPQAPSDPFLYVTELHGAIKVVAQDGSVSDYFNGVLNYPPPLSFPGSGEQGLTGIAVDPATGDLFASMLYLAEDGNKYAKIMRFHTGHGGAVAESASLVIDMAGDPMAPSHQISNLSIGPDGMLYAHVGDGNTPQAARDLNDFRGKILRMGLDGSAPPDNPFYEGPEISARDYVFAFGFRNPFGGAWRSADGLLYEVENGPSTDRFAKVESGEDYLWDGFYNMFGPAEYVMYTWTPSTAPVNLAFIEAETYAGSGFPNSKMGHAFVSLSGPTYASGPQEKGKRIEELSLRADGSRADVLAPLVRYTGTGRATVAGLAAGPDGLYFTDLYKDLGASGPTERGAQVLRVKWVGE